MRHLSVPSSCFFFRKNFVEKVEKHLMVPCRGNLPLQFNQARRYRCLPFRSLANRSTCLRARVNSFFERDYDSYGRHLEDERSRDSTYWLHVNSQSRSQIYEHSQGNLAKKYFDSPKGRVCDEENARSVPV